MKLLKWSTIIVSITIVFIIPLSLYGYVKFKNNEVANETYQYLVEKGYSDSDILSIEPKIKKLSLFTAEVRFVDEPDIIYNYKSDDNSIIQLNPDSYDENYEFKHKEH